MAHPTTPPPPAGIKNDITIHAPPPIKAKTPVIVLHQGKSRQTLKYKDAILPSALRSGTANLRIGRAGAAAPPHPNEDAPPVTVSADPYRTSLTRNPPIKAKSPAIKANRASSRQTLNNQTAIMPPVLQPKTAAPPTGRAGGAPPPHIPYSVWPATQSPEFGPPAGNPPPNVLFVTSRPCAFASKTQQSSLIKPNRTASRQP